MTGERKVLIAGATGVVGLAAMAHFAEEGDCDVVALSRRPPRRTYGARHVSVDLMDAEACQAAAIDWDDVTHLVYAALYEKPQLYDGWLDPEQIETNATMFRNLMDALLPVARNLRHVTLLQGTKAYGTHIRRMPVPARENRDEFEHPNFYWDQQDLLLARAAAANWSWTILRPVLIFGEASGGPMDLIPPLGVYGALLAESDHPLYFPGGAPRVGEAVDADLLARVIGWAGQSPNAANEIFNVTNGDVFTWPAVWPAVAAALGMEAGENQPYSLAENMPGRTDEWRDVAEKHGLVDPDLDRLVGIAFQYADICLGYGRDRPGTPVHSSTIKLRQAGFHECIDTEVMLAKWFRRAQDHKLLPPRC